MKIYLYVCDDVCCDGAPNLTLSAPHAPPALYLLNLRRPDSLLILWPGDVDAYVIVEFYMLIGLCFHLSHSFSRGDAAPTCYIS